MPYDSRDELPQSVRDGLSERCQDVWRRVFNETFEATDGDEARASATAWTAGHNCESAALPGGAMKAQFKHAKPHELKLDDAGGVTVAFAQLNVVDHDSDVTRPGAFPTKDVPMSAYGHTSWEGAPPIGRGSIREAGDWAVFAGQFLMETDHGRNAYHTVKAMAELQEWSYGYLPTKVSFGQQDGRQVRYLEALDVYEVSPVLVGAGLGTHTLDIKQVDLLSAGPAETFIDRVSTATGEMQMIAAEARKRLDLRVKEGRVLSTANANRLASLADVLAQAADDLRDLLASAETPKARNDRQVAILVERLRLFGIDVTE